MPGLRGVVPRCARIRYSGFDRRRRADRARGRGLSCPRRAARMRPPDRHALPDADARFHADSASPACCFPSSSRRATIERPTAAASRPVRRDGGVPACKGRFRAGAGVGDGESRSVESSAARIATPPRRRAGRRSLADLGRRSAGLRMIARLGRRRAALLRLVAARRAARPGAGDGDPPGRVGRLAETFGQVWLYSPDAGEWIAPGAIARSRPATASRPMPARASSCSRLDDDAARGGDRDRDPAARRRACRAAPAREAASALRVRDSQAAGEFELRPRKGGFRCCARGAIASTAATLERPDRLRRPGPLRGPRQRARRRPGQRGEFWLEPNGAAQYSVTDPLRDASPAGSASATRDDGRRRGAAMCRPR